MRWIVRALIAVLVVAVGSLGFVGWQTASAVSRILTVGAMSQEEGAAPPAGPTDIGYRGDPGRAFGARFDAIDISTELGPAPAWLVRPDEGDDMPTWAIVVHGIGGARENGYRFWPALNAAGLPTLFITYRNDPDAPASPENAYLFGLTEWRDLDAAVGYALAHGARDVVLVGESMGGGIVGQMLARSANARYVSAVVLDAPAIDIERVLSSLLAQRGIPLPELMAWAGVTTSRFVMPVSLEGAKVTRTLARFSGPLFLSHGEGDRLVPVATSDELAALRPRTTTYIRGTGGHLQVRGEDPARYDAALTDFLRNAVSP